MGLVKDIKNLLKGVQITSKHLGRHAVTLQYPEEKMEMPARSRGAVVLLSDKETGELNCTSCLLCMKACPTAAILIESPRGEDKRRHLQRFNIDNSLCCFCGLCEEACNFSALKMAPQIYEFSTLNKDDLIWDMNKLQEMGLDVDYIDTRKKKKPKATTQETKTTVTTEKSKEQEKQVRTEELKIDIKPESPKAELKAEPDLKSTPKPNEHGQQDKQSKEEKNDDGKDKV